MSKVWIEEYSKRRDGSPGLILANQQITIGAASVPSSAFNVGTAFIRIHGDAAAYYKLGTAPVAVADTTSEHLISSLYVDRAVPVAKNYKIAVIQV